MANGVASVNAGAAGPTTWHVVGHGETMAGIARTYRLRVADLGRWNQIVAPYPVHVDETLRLTRPATPLPAWRTRSELVTPLSVGWDPRKRCPLAPVNLRRVWVSYLDFRGAYHEGSIVVHKYLVAATQRSFLTLFRWRYRIMAMEPFAVNTPGHAVRSAATTGYECRRAAGSTTWSEHAYGRAIDLNPLQNPMILGKEIIPPGGVLWLRRDRYKIGMVHAEGAVRALTANGFSWGGRWKYTKDYQHFSPSNR